MKTENLTLGERVFLSRRRKGLTQRGAAERLGLSRRQFQELEAGRVDDEYIKGVETILTRFAAIDAIHDHERCVISRRRAGKSMTDMEAGTGKSRQWIYEMEAGRSHCGLLLNFWGLVGDGLPL